MVLSAAENNNVDLYDLVSKTISSYRYGQSRASVLRINLDKQYNDQYLLLIAERLSSFEISILLKASEVRERGLALARSGDVHNDGGKALDAAREISVEANLSREALITAESFQAPADAYLQYKRKEYGEAYASLVAALKACQILRDEYGHKVEGRRIHLVRNIIRVEAVAGNLNEAMRLASSLLRYIESGNECWPFPELRLLTLPDPLTLEEKWVLMDQILGEIASLLANPKDTARQLLKVSESYLFRRDIDSQFAQVHLWLAAMRASVEEDLECFLNNAIRFFSDGPGYLDQAWRKMVQHFVQICMEVAPEALLQELAVPSDIAI